MKASEEHNSYIFRAKNRPENLVVHADKVIYWRKISVTKVRAENSSSC